MAKSIYTGISGIARNTKNIYVGVNGVARKVTKGYIGVGGVARQFWPYTVTYSWKKYRLDTTTIYTEDNDSMRVFRASSAPRKCVLFEGTQNASLTSFLYASNTKPYINSSGSVVWPSGSQLCEVNNRISVQEFDCTTTPKYIYSTSGRGFWTSRASGDYNGINMEKCMVSHIDTAYGKWGTAATHTSDQLKGMYVTWDSSYNLSIVAMCLGMTSSTTKTLVGTVTSTNPNAYPTNGKHTDGYWYIKQ